MKSYAIYFFASAALSASAIFTPIYARDLGANDACRIAVVLGAVQAADAVVAQQLHVEGAGRWTVMRASRVTDGELGVSVHGTNASRVRER